MKSQIIRFSLALEARGEKRDVNARSTKYTVYSRTGTDKFFYLGCGGALRTGHTVGGSIPVNDKFKRLLLDEADAILAKDRRAKPSWLQHRDDV
jgi:hypothetical protein